MAKFKIKHTISKKEWNKTHKDFKSIIDGIHYVMKYDNKTGTHLVPVNIEESINEFLRPSDVDSVMKEKGIKKIPISSQGERLLKGMVKEKFFDKVTNKERLVYFYQSLGNERFGYGVKGKPLSPLVDRFSNDLMDYSITFGGKMAAYQVAMNIKDRLANREEVDSTYYMLKDYFNSFGMDTNRSRVFKSANFYMDDWLKRNKNIASQIGESIDEGMFSLIDQIRDESKNVKDFIKNVLSDRNFKDMKNDKQFIQYLGSIYESVNEAMDINDPILVRLRASAIEKAEKEKLAKIRAAQMKKNQMAAKKLQQAELKIKALKMKRAEVMRDMEQEAEAEGGPIADRYGNLLNRIDNDIIKLGGNPMSESVNEAKDFETYHKSYTHAIEAARAAALKKGFEVEDDEMFTKVGMNSKRPSVGKTTRVSLELVKNGKPQRKMLHIQVYGMKNGYELNSYIN
jgi:hypothetical protein